MKTSKTKIAIMGANSHIAKGLIGNFILNENYQLHLYSTNAQKVEIFLNTLKNSTNKDYNVIEGYKDFINDNFDVIINCVGVGTSNKMDENYWKWFTVTEEFDNLAILYLKKNIDALYISISSGAVYGKGFSEPTNENSLNIINVNNLTKEDYYSIARLNAETKHRSFENLNIIDLRMYSYFSRYIDLSDKYLLTEIINSIILKTKFTTNEQNIVRDFVHPKDLFSLILKCIQIGKINDVFDVYSAEPITKNQILGFYKTVYNLDFTINKNKNMLSGTGTKNIYYSVNHKAKNIGYLPQYTSLDVIKDESESLLNNR